MPTAAAKPVRAALYARVSTTGHGQVKQAGHHLGLPGRLTARTFQSWNIPSDELLLANTVYTLCNETHHTGRHPATTTHGSWNVHLQDQPDGVVTARPAHFDQLEHLSREQFFLAITRRAIELEHEPTPFMTRHWLQATRELLAQQAPRFPRQALPRVVPLTGKLQQQRVRQRIRHRPTSPPKFPPRQTAPSLAEFLRLLRGPP